MDKDTVLCRCFGVTYGDIEKAVEEGACSYDEVSEATSCGQGCGRCAADIARVAKQLIKKSAKK